MKVAYIIAPYRARTEYGVKRHIDEAEAVAIKLWQAGFAVICPHKNTAFFGGLCDDATWLRADIAFLKRSDFAVTVGNYRGSSGCMGEINAGEDMGKPIYGSAEEAIKREMP